MEISSTLRLPPEVDEKVKAEARAERRSKNQQIVFILEERYGLVSEHEKEVKLEKTIAPAAA